jgi:hypothetical protein
MNQQRPSNRNARRLERRNEREARQPGGAPPPSRRRRTPQAVSGGRSGGFNLLPIAVFVGVIGIVAVLIYAVASANDTPGDPDWLTAELDASSNLPGTYVQPHPGFDGKFDPTNPNNDDRQHVASGSVEIPICSQELIDADAAVTDVYADRSNIGECYHSNPPTSGPHADRPMEFTVLENPAPKENLIHNMEHGGVVVWYNTTDQAVIDQLADIVNDQLDRRRFVVMSFYDGMEPDTIALTAWSRLDKFPVSEMTEDRVVDFIDTHHKRFNPEGF